MDPAACEFTRAGASGLPAGQPAGHTFCYTCFTNCTFNVDHAAMIHNLVRSTIANTGLFDGFFYKMSQDLGYGSMADPNDWWNMSLPALGVDTSIGAGKGGYKK